MTDGHEISERANLLMHHKIAGIVDSRPDLLALLRGYIGRTINETGGTSGQLLWQSVLQHPWEKVRQCMLDPGPDGRLLRSNTTFPFIIGPMDESERQEMWKQAQNELISESAGAAFQ